MGQRQERRFTARSPRWEEPLSTIQKTRCAENAGLLAHDFRHQPIEGQDATARFATTEEPGALHIPGRQIDHGAR